MFEHLNIPSDIKEKGQDIEVMLIAENSTSFFSPWISPMRYKLIMKTVDIPCENKNELVTQAIENKWINLLNILTRSRWDFYFERFFKFGRFMIITAGGFCLLIYMFSKIKDILQPSVMMQSLTELQILNKALDRPF